MIHLIANKIVENLASLTIVDKITGIVKPAKVYINNVVKTYPIAYNTDPDVCSQSQLLDFVPDSSKRSIIYFEDYGTSQVKLENQKAYWQATFRLIVWFNYKKILPVMSEPSLIALNVLNLIPGDLGNFDNLQGVFVEVTSQLPNDVSPFSRYSYQEERTQYVTYPYDYVAFVLRAEFSTRIGCIDDLTPTLSVC